MNKQQVQECLNTHPDNSPFWDSPRGQEALELAEEFNLSAMNTNRERCQIHRELMSAA